jgi:N-acetyl-gamma-glutamyl-phosphate reductase
MDGELSMAKVFIDGEAGTTGLGIRARLVNLPEIELIGLSESDRKNADARREAMRASDVTVLCLPDDAAVQAVAIAQGLGAAAPKILDASTSHRVAEGWTFGFAELAAGQAAANAAARLVSNPGCYPTGAIALLRPLVKAGMLARDADVTINAVSGYSGGGKAMIAAHERDGGPPFELYGLGLRHKHVPEIMRYAGLRRRPIFVPSVGHFRQGMLVSIPLFLDGLAGAPSAHEVSEVYREYFDGVLRVRPAAGVSAGNLDPEALNDTDLLEIFVCADGDQAVLVARLDNLGKGASGAAVQNIALMLGLADPLLALKEHVHA